MERHRSEYGGPRDPDCPSRGAEATLAPPSPMVEGNRLVEKPTGIESLCDGLDSASGDDLCYEDVDTHVSGVSDDGDYSSRPETRLKSIVISTQDGGRLGQNEDGGRVLSSRDRAAASQLASLAQRSAQPIRLSGLAVLVRAAVRL